MTDAIVPSLLAASAVAAGVAAWGTFMPRSRLWGKNISRGSSAPPPRIALTFDDGPTPAFTDAILDILADLRVPAAFFVIGLNAQRSPDLLCRIHAAGHLIGNHTYDHAHLGVFRAGRYWHDQISRTDDVIQQITGQRPTFFRPPMGTKHWYITRAARHNGHTLVTWTRRAFDGLAATTPDQILARLTSPTCPGDILTLHDGVDPHSSRSPRATVDSLRPLILALRHRGLEFSRLDDLLALSPCGRGLG